MDAGSQYPHTLLPQIACFVLQESLVHDKTLYHRYQFDAAEAERLFGSAATILELFSSEATQGIDDSGVKLVVAASLAARGEAAIDTHYATRTSIGTVNPVVHV